MSSPDLRFYILQAGMQPSQTPKSRDLGSVVPAHPTPGSRGVTPSPTVSVPLLQCSNLASHFVFSGIAPLKSVSRLLLPGFPLYPVILLLIALLPHLLHEFPGVLVLLPGENLGPGMWKPGTTPLPKEHLLNTCIGLLCRKDI